MIIAEIKKKQRVPYYPAYAHARVSHEYKRTFALLPNLKCICALIWVHLPTICFLVNCVFPGTRAYDYMCRNKARKVFC